MQFYIMMGLLIACRSLAAAEAIPPSAAPLTPVQLAVENDPDYTLYLKSSFSNAKWDALVQQGFRSYANGQVVQAVDFLQKAVAQGATSPFVYFKLAAAYEYLGNAYTAIQYYELAQKELATLPTDHEYVTRFHESYARALLSNNQVEQAVPHLEQAAKTSAEFWVLSALADYYLTQNNLAAALPQLLRAVEVPSIHAVPTPQIAQIYLAIAKIYLIQNNADEASRFLDYALQTDPTNQEALALKNRAAQERMSTERMQQLEKMMEFYK